MFNPGNEEQKLDWIYKGPSSTVDREDYLLGRTIDKTLEQLNDEERQKQGLSLPTTAKNRVEHECIPPSIRDFNKIVQAEQVDLSAKLQEDPLVAIKKREEETRRQFLQNPVQLKKLQKALKAQEKLHRKKKKKSKKRSKHHDDDNSDSDVDISNKLRYLKGDITGTAASKNKKEDKDLDTILIHKYAALKSMVTQKDLQDVVEGKLTDSDEDNSDSEGRKRGKSGERDSDSGDQRESEKDRPRNRRHQNEFVDGVNKDDNNINKRYHRTETSNYGRQNYSQRKQANEDRHSNRKHAEQRHRSQDRSRDSSSDCDRRKPNWGLVKADGSKIPLKKPASHTGTPPKDAHRNDPPSNNKTDRKSDDKPRKLSEKEKDDLRKQMMDNAAWRDKERARNVKKYKESEDKDAKQEKNFDPEFVHKQLLKSANVGTVEGRIKANLNNIQRSSRDMNRNFSKR